MGARARAATKHAHGHGSSVVLANDGLHEWQTLQDIHLPHPRHTLWALRGIMSSVAKLGLHWCRQTAGVSKSSLGLFAPVDSNAGPKKSK